MYDFSQIIFCFRKSRLLVIGAFCLPVCGYAQTTYYVAQTGLDANDGRSVARPFRTVARANQLRIQPGDSLLFRRGDSFGAGLAINQSGTAQKPIVIAAYGSGPKPRLTGAVTVSGWVQQGNGLWRAACPDCGPRPTALFRNDTALPMGRYPNADAANRGYLTVKSHVGNRQLESGQTLTGDWAGAEAVLRPSHWIIDRARVTAHQGNSLTLDNRSTYPLIDGWGFFLQNHLATLDQPGEWFYDADRKTVWLIDKVSDPNNHTITAAVVDQGLVMTDVANVHLTGLHLTQTRTEGIRATNVQSLTLSHLDLTNLGEDGLMVVGTGRNLLIEHNRIANVNNNGLWVSHYRNVRIRNNTLHRIGIWPGRGKSGDGNYNGLHSEIKSNGRIELNKLDSIGYNGISFADSTLIRRNIVSNFCMVKSDGGGLYIWNGEKRPMRGIQIEENLIFRGIGTPDGTQNGLNSGANGIFLDDCVWSDDAAGVSLTGNTVFDCSGYGIYLHAVSDVRVVGNTAFNNRVCQFIMHDNGGKCQTRQNTVKHNRFVSRDAEQWVVGYLSHTDDLPRYGTIDSNYYARPFDDTFTLRVVYNRTTGDDLTLAQWQRRFGHDQASHTSPYRLTPYSIDSLNAVNRLPPAPNSTTDGWSVWSSDGSGRVASTTDGPLGKGGLRVDFQTQTTAASAYALLNKPIGRVKKGEQLLVRFEGVTTMPRKVEVFLRQREAPYADLSSRHVLLIDITTQAHQHVFTATATDSTALLVFQVRNDGQPLWLRTVRVQGGRFTTIAPDSLLRLVYNPNTTDSLIRLPGRYRDVAGKIYRGSFTLAPFTSVVLLADTTRPPVLASPVPSTQVPSTQTDPLGMQPVVNRVVRVLVAPNPFHEQIRFVLEFASGISFPPDLTLTLTDLSGRTVWSSTRQGRIGPNEFSWNGTANTGKLLPGGLYLYRFTLGTTPADFQQIDQTTLQGRVILAR